MKYRWRDGKAQAMTYVPALNRCVVVAEANSIHELYGGDEGDETDDDDDETDDDDDEE